MRDAPRLHVGQALAEGGRVALDADRAHYLLHVMRAAAGDPVRVFNAASGEWLAHLAEGGRREAALRIATQTRPPVKPAGSPTLIFAPLKRDATDTVVRMATELGVCRLLPVITRRTIASRVNEARLALIAREAAEQCERLDLPDIGSPVTLPELLGAWDRSVRIAAAIERAAAPLLGVAATAAGAVLVGPEGGWAPEELDQLARAPFVQAVSLGALVLRADTAAVAALAALQTNAALAVSAAEGWGGGDNVEPG